MANFSTSANVVVSMNGQQAKNMMESLQRDAKRLRSEIDKAASAGDKVSLKRLTSELRGVERAMDQIRNQGKSVDDVLSRLDKASPRELQKTLRTLQQQLNGIERGSKAWDEHVEKIKRVKEEIAQVNQTLRTQEGVWSRVASGFNKYLGVVTAGLASITGLVMAGRKAVGDYASMEEEMANTRKFTGMTEEQVRDLNEEFKKMDTRTAREELNLLAQEAGRLGKQSKEDVLGYVKAADVINVALSDLGEGATQDIAKLTNIFNIEDEYGTYEAMLKVGSVVNVLSQNCTASKPYLVEFANRMAGIGGAAHISVQDIIGLGAVLDANAQKVESSSTAIAQVLTRMYKEPAKYARAAGLDVKAFSDLLAKDANEAFLVFLESMNRAGGMESLAPMFADMGENGARVVTTLSVLSGKIDEVRAQQEVANRAFEEGNSVLKEYDIFNNTKQAELDKAKKRVHELAIELGQRLYPVMRYVLSGTNLLLKVMSEGVRFIVEHRKEIGVLVIALGSYYVAANAARIAQLGKNAAIVVGRVAVSAYTAAVKLATAAALLFTGNIKGATTAFKAFSAAVRANPLGLLVSGISAVVSSLFIFNESVEESREEVRDFSAEAKQLRKDIESVAIQAEKSAKDEIEVIRSLCDAAADETKSREERIAAVEKLQSQYPDYFGNLTTEQIMLGQTTQAYEELRIAILAAARARAGAEMISKLDNEIFTLEREAAVERDILEQAQKRRDEVYDEMMSLKVTRGSRDKNGYEVRTEDVYWNGQHITIRSGEGQRFKALVKEFEQLNGEYRNYIEQSSMGEVATKLGEAMSMRRAIMENYGISEEDIVAAKAMSLNGPSVGSAAGGGLYGSASVGGGLGDVEEAKREASLAAEDASRAARHADVVAAQEAFSRATAAAERARAVAESLSGKEAEKAAKLADAAEKSARSAQDAVERAEKAAAGASARAEREEGKAEREAERARQDELKAALKREKGVWEAGEAANYAEYESGLIGWREYLWNRYALEVDYYDARKRVYEERNLQESEEYSNLLKRRGEAVERWQQKLRKVMVDDYKRMQKEEENNVELGFSNPDSVLYQDEEARQAALFEIRRRYLGLMRDLYERNSEEWHDYSVRLDEADQDELLRRQKWLLKGLGEWKKKYRDLDADVQLRSERALLDALYQEHYISLEDYERALKDLEKKYGVDLLPDSAKGSADSPQALAERMAEDMAVLERLYANGRISKEVYEAAKDRIEEFYAKRSRERARGFGSEYTNQLLDIYEAFRKFFDDTEEDGGNWATRLSGVMSSVFAVMSQGMSMASDFIRAQADADVAEAERMYDRQIELAQGNSYKTQRLEREREEEIARIKNEAEGRMYDMKVIEAVAQTATNALNAYGSAAQVPMIGYILAPIAASMAIAAGAIQIATIKKQQQAAVAKGYSEGGFTPDGGRDEVVGVVHAGEWVASQRLTRDGRVRPLLEALDYAQRTNRIGSIRMADVSRAVMAPMVVAAGSVGNGSGSAVGSGVEGVRGSGSVPEGFVEVLGRLADRLDEPFVTVNSVTGEFGMKSAQDRYNRLIGNKSRKSR